MDIYRHQLSPSRRQRNASAQADPSLTGTLILLLLMETGSLHPRVVFVKYFINSQKHTLFCSNYHPFLLCSWKWMGPVIHRSSLLYLINPCSVFQSLAFLLLSAAVELYSGKGDQTAWLQSKLPGSNLDCLALDFAFASPGFSFAVCKIGD